ncbi:MAG: AAA family ATPase [Bacilli bacterium]|nr:AAA family ATPase [Bacilli bacterium]
MILKSMDIYHFIENKEMICNSNDFMNTSKQKKLNKIDKRCISLFLASLLLEGDIQNIMNDCDVNKKMVLDYLHIESKKFLSLKEEEYVHHFNADFKLLLGTLKNAQNYRYGELPNGAFFPTTIIYNLAYNHICGSDIIDQFYKDAKLESVFAFEHNSYKLIEELSDQKLKEQGLVKKELPNSEKSFMADMHDLISSNTKKELSDTILDELGESLTQKEYQSNPAINREQELKHLMVALLSSQSAMLVGETGVGKTAIIEGLSYLIKNKQVPTLLTDTEIIKINTGDLTRGCIYHGMLEERIKKLVLELMDNKNKILFIDEIHTVIGAGATSNGGLDIANQLKPYLDRGQIRIIGATTNEEYESYILKDPALKRHFEKVSILEQEEIIIAKILNTAIDKMEKAIQVKFDFTDEEKRKIIDYIVTCTNKKNRVYNDIVNNPSLALSILKKAFALAAFYGSSSVKIEHITEAIRTSHRLYEGIRNRKAAALEVTFNYQNSNKEKHQEKIIKFPIHHTK